MNRKSKNLILLGGVIIVFLFFSVFRLLNDSIERHINEQVQKIKEDLMEEVTEAPQQEIKKVKRELVASNLESYTIAPQRKSNLFKNQQYWDIETRKVLGRPEIINRLHQKELFKGTPRSAQQLDNQIERVEGRIHEYKQRIRNDPYDEYARQKLQDLYMLKSTVRIISENMSFNGGSNH